MESHLSICPKCQAEVVELKRIRLEEGADRLVDETVLVPRRWSHVHWPTAVAATLLMTCIVIPLLVWQSATHRQEVAVLKRENDELNLRVAEGEPQRVELDRRNELLEELQGRDGQADSHDANSSDALLMTVDLVDNGSNLEIDQNGYIEGLRYDRDSDRDKLLRTLRTQKAIITEPVPGLFGGRSNLMDEGRDEFRLIAPIATAILQTGQHSGGRRCQERKVRRKGLGQGRQSGGSES